MNIKIINITAIIIGMLLIIYLLCRVFLFSVVINGGTNSAPNLQKAEEHFVENFDEFSFVAKALYEIEYDYIALREVDKNDDMYVSNDSSVDEMNYSDNIPIPSKELADNIKKLYKEGIRAIFKQNNCIEFATWSSLSESRGIIYSIDEQVPQINWIINLEPLSIKNWYYYVDNYEKYHKQNPTL